MNHIEIITYHAISERCLNIVSCVIAWTYCCHTQAMVRKHVTNSEACCVEWAESSAMSFNREVRRSSPINSSRACNTGTRLMAAFPGQRG